MPVGPCSAGHAAAQGEAHTYTEDERRAPLRALLAAALPDQDAAVNEEVAALSGTQLRDRLIAHNPLDRDWIARTNQVPLLMSASH